MNAIEIPQAAISGGINSLEVFVEDLAFPSNIISINQNWRIHVEWNIRGLNMADLNHSWNLQAILEEIGPNASEELIYTTTSPLHFHSGKAVASNQYNYQADIPIPAGKVKTPGAYKLVLTLTVPNVSLAGYFEGPILQFYQPH
jgi:hypothetical protein